MSISPMFKTYLAQHPNDGKNQFPYGTSGFREKAELLDHVAFRMGILAAIRSRSLNGKAVGIIITASHNPAPDNGIKAFDYHGELLDSVWEHLSTKLVNIPDKDIEEKIADLINDYEERESGIVLVGHDPRESSPSLVEACIDGLKSMQCVFSNFGLITTPQLQFIVHSYNNNPDNGTLEYYYNQFTSAFNELCSLITTDISNYDPSVTVDCANGSAGQKLARIVSLVSAYLKIKPFNTDGMINEECGSDLVKTYKKLPANCDANINIKVASFDGDADRIVYFYKQKTTDDSISVRLLDGDKIACLFASYIDSLLIEADLKGQLQFIAVQTAYANGASTNYLKEVIKVPVFCVATGVKNLVQKSKQADIAVFFEANGHGSILFSKTAIDVMRTKDSVAAKKLLLLNKCINQVTGDAITDLLVVEAILRAKNWSIQDWDAIYEDFPSRLEKVVVTDRTVLETTDNALICLKPIGLQKEIDSHISKFHGNSRAFVRPSGTENIVRIYAESSSQAMADALAAQVKISTEKYCEAASASLKGNIC